LIVIALETGGGALLAAPAVGDDDQRRGEATTVRRAHFGGPRARDDALDRNPVFDVDCGIAQRLFQHARQRRVRQHVAQRRHAQTIGVEHILPHLEELEPAPAAASRHDEILDVVDRLGTVSAAELRAEIGLSRTTLRRALAELTGMQVLQVVGEGQGTRYARPASTQAGAAALTARQQLILEHVRTAGRVTRQECAEVAGISLHSARRELAVLVELGWLRADGRVGNAAGDAPT
jgi:predicted HTH transcriptional regulator